MTSKQDIERAPWCIMYNDDAFFSKGGEIFGRRAAGTSYLRAIAQQDYKEAGVLVRNTYEKNNFVNLFTPFIKEKDSIDVKIIPWTSPQLSEEFGGIFIGDPQLGNYSVLRSKFGHDSYSIVGITHTTLTQRIHEYINDIHTKPVKEWDALICTSRCVRDSIEIILSNGEEILRDRLGAKKFIRPELPIIPLGVHMEDYNHKEEEKYKFRENIGASKDDIIIIFVGRLSFHSKAHHFPMYKSLQKLTEDLDEGRCIHLIQVGWFANDYIGDIMKKEVEVICPDVKCHFIDGLDQDLKNLSLASADIFLSLVDNFQETFGLTPLEGMAAGIPAVVSDWNGYRDTVRNGLDGFTVPTVTLDKGNGQDLLYHYYAQVINYDQFLAYSSQTVSIDIQSCINSLSELILNESIRKKMSKSAKKRAETEFSWDKIMIQYCDLRDHLNKKRSTKRDKSTYNYMEGYDPYKLFASYPSTVLKDSSLIKSNVDKPLDKEHYIFTSLSINVSTDMNRTNAEDMGLTLNIGEVNQILDLLGDKILTLKEISGRLDISSQKIQRTIIMMMKFDIIDLVMDN